MNTLLFIGMLLFGFGLLIFSMKLMAYNRRKYGFEDSEISSDSDFSKVISRNTFRLLAIVILIILIVILYLKPQ
jgi:TRAP-type C4-dicarboxylate transport system permease large subunit|tara:strand:+ start:775 stop:996 length:222 start_codon:yes stop_codon:yes gene_type:complete